MSEQFRGSNGGDGLRGGVGGNGGGGGFDQSDALGLRELLPAVLPVEPFGLFCRWFAEAERLAGVPNPNAMTVATVGVDGLPSARVVLCKSIDASAGHVVFYTNYNGRKGRELDATGVAAAVFHWDRLERQVRIEGRVTRSPAEESDAYFRSRPLLSRLGAWSSDQSEPISSREALVEKVAGVVRRLVPGVDDGGGDVSGGRGGLEALLSRLPLDADVPRPAHWGGYRLRAERVELWTSSDVRLHDRAEWVRRADGGWLARRLQP